jgi:exodeoxyribonuclease-5
MILTNEQEIAIEKAKKWYLSDNRKPFVIMGGAGTGKSTIVKYIIESIGIDKEVNTKYVTYTGKAASVLIKKGNKTATTIHKLIYDPIFDKDGNVIGFDLKESLDEFIKLIIVDEFYMVNNQIMKDLLSFGIKIICLGDNNQLPPPFGEVNELCQNPDALLTEPLRQSLDNPIIYLAEQARKHKFLKVGNYGDGINVIRKSDLDLERLMNCDQIIAGKNDTVKKLNSFYRNNFKGINKDIWIPQKGEKLICLKNNWNLICSEEKLQTNLVNGLGVILEDDLEVYNSTKHGLATVRPDFYNDHAFKKIIIDLLYFEFNFNKEEDLYNSDNIKNYNYGEYLKKRKIFFDNQLNKINKFTFGYAITCHKSQGSEWDDVYFIFEPFKGYKDPLYWQMLYTGITRASKKLTVCI